MRSIRLFLIVVILASITMIIFLSALHGYRQSMVEAHKLFDTRLADTARLLSVSRNEQADGNGVVIDAGLTAIQIWRNGRVLLRSSTAPVVPLAPFAEGYGDNNFNNYRWRTYSYHDARHGRWIQTAERTDLRYSLADNIIIESVLPVMLIIPLGGLLIWTIVSYGLSPLRRLAMQLQSKRADDLSPLPVERQPVELLQVIRSTNDLLHRLEASFERERRFASDAAHELRPPISALKVHVHNLMEAGNGDSIGRHRDSLAQTKHAIDRIGHLVEQILALNRTTSEQFLNRLEPVELHALVQSMIVRMFPEFDAAGLQLELQGAPVTIRGNRFALETMVQNLLANACKYTPPGGAVIIRAEPAADGAVLQVDDSGPGVPADQYERLFDRFYRLDGDRHASGRPGCGLGLAIVRHICDLHRAEIRLGRSSFASGLGVSVRFPSMSGQHIDGLPG